MFYGKTVVLDTILWEKYLQDVYLPIDIYAKTSLRLSTSWFYYRNGYNWIFSTLYLSNIKNIFVYLSTFRMT